MKFFMIVLCFGAIYSAQGDSVIFENEIPSSHDVTVRVTCSANDIWHEISSGSTKTCTSEGWIQVVDHVRPRHFSYDCNNSSQNLYVYASYRSSDQAYGWSFECNW